MKRILFVATEYSPGMIPYAAKIINVLTNSSELDVYGIFVNSFNMSYISMLTEDVKEKSVLLETHHRNPMKLLDKFYPIQVIQAIKQSIKKNKIDIVHFLTGDFSLGLYNKFFGFKRVELYFTVHDLHPHQINKLPLFREIVHQVILWGNKQNLLYVENVCTSSKSQYTELMELFPHKSIYYTNFPTLVNKEIKKGTFTAPEISGNRGYILFFGSVHRYKGVELLIEAYKSLQNKEKPSLIIAGKGILDLEIQSDENIIWINRFISDSEIKNLFENALCVIYPYLSATMSGVLSISEYFNKRTILSDIPFFIENKTDNCSFFKSGSKVSLMKALEKVLISIDLDELNKSSYSDNYSTLRLVDSYISMYNNCKINHETIK